MLQLDEQVVNKIVNDSTMITLMSITASDDRVYSWYPSSDIIYTEGTTETAIIYRNSMGGRPFNWSYPSQIPNITYFFRVLSINQLKLRQVSERLIALFDKTTISSANWSVKWIEVSSYTDGMNEGGPSKPIVSKNLTFNFQIVVYKESV